MTYIAFLRAINVGGRAVVKMTALRDAFAAAGCRNVRTYIASGNVVFEVADDRFPATLKKVRGTLKALIGHEPGVVVRTLRELEALVKRAPFKDHERDRSLKLYVAFLGEKPKARPAFPINSAKEALDAIGMYNLHVFVVSRRKPNGMYGFPNQVVEEAVLVTATTRNWTTVTKVLDFARGPRKE